MKVMVMAGTRPEAIKIAPIMHELSKHSEFTPILCNTGQHREMIAQALSDFNIRADINLDIMTQNQTLATLSSQLFEKVSQVLSEERPEWILVQGDTTTVMISALCAFYQNIKIGHVEAGLRSFNKRAPFPEEVNREIVSKVADLHFAPTVTAFQNLISEKVSPANVIITGNTSIDALYMMKNNILNQEDMLDVPIRKALAEGKKIILVTGHRRENLGNGFIEICQAIKELANKYQDIVFVYPVHLNPNVRVTVHEILAGHPRIFLLDPLPYKKFIALLLNSYFVLTDSGGIQEEAPAVQKPVLVMRDVTERPEGVTAGVSKLVGARQHQIVQQASLLLEDSAAWNSMVCAKNPYGDGKAAHRIVEALRRFK